MKYYRSSKGGVNMYSIKINYGLNKGDVTVFTNKKELKEAFKSEKNLDKYIGKIKKEVKKHE